MPSRREGPIAGILLAAGTASRMGSNKMLLPLEGESVLRRAARRRTLSPSRGRSILLLPMRLAVPAASRMPAMGPSRRDGMDRLLAAREMDRLPPGDEGEQLGDDAQGDLT